MNVNTILITQDEAEQKLESYRSLKQRQRTVEDDLLQSLYQRIRAGGRVLNLVEAFKQTGLNEQGQPRLAIARADWGQVSFMPRVGFSGNRWIVGAGGFSPSPRWNNRATRLGVALPANTFDEKTLTRHSLRSPVPHIPPELRPPFALLNYHILFEVKEWQSYPVDPFLLKRISGYLYVVMAEWELTELEVMILSSMQPVGN